MDPRKFSTPHQQLAWILYSSHFRSLEEREREFTQIFPQYLKAIEVLKNLKSDFDKVITRSEYKFPNTDSSKHSEYFFYYKLSDNHLYSDINAAFEYTYQSPYCLMRTTSTLLNEAVKRGSVFILDSLLEAKATPYPLDNPLLHPISIATEYRHPHMVQALLKRGFVPTHQSIWNEALSRACQTGDEGAKIIPLLLEAGASLGTKADQYHFLSLTLERSTVASTAELIRAGVDVNYKPLWENASPLVRAKGSQLQTIRCLLEAKAYLDVPLQTLDLSKIYSLLINHYPIDLNDLLKVINKMPYAKKEAPTLFHFCQGIAREKLGDIHDAAMEFKQALPLPQAFQKILTLMETKMSDTLAPVIPPTTSFWQALFAPAKFKPITPEFRQSMMLECCLFVISNPGVSLTAEQWLLIGARVVSIEFSFPRLASERRQLGLDAASHAENIALTKETKKSAKTLRATCFRLFDRSDSPDYLAKITTEYVGNADSEEVVKKLYSPDNGASLLI